MSQRSSPFVIVSGSIHVSPHRRDEFLASSRDAMIEARRTAGCLDFVVAPDPLESDRVNVYEEWESEEALSAFRGAGPGPSLAALVVRARVRRHAIASTGPA
jgi:heme-degrading monooxygenase HmoA